MNSAQQQFRAKLTKRTGPFRRAVLRGLGTLLPPLLTIGILLWIGNSVGRYLLEPLEASIRWVMVDQLADIRTPSEIITRPDGHDIAELTAALRRAKADDARTRPCCIIARTLKGKGVSYMETEPGWHLGYLDPSDADAARAEILSKVI